MKSHNSNSNVMSNFTGTDSAGSMNAVSNNAVPGALAQDVANLTMMIAQDVKPKLDPKQWLTVKVLLQSLQKESVRALTQYYENKPNAEETEALFKPLHQELDLLEDFLSLCLLKTNESH